MSDPATPADAGSEVTASSQYVRARHALLLRADFGPIFRDHYLHLMQHGIRLDPAHDGLLTELLAALVLHLISRPRDEGVAWTLNLQSPRLNLFVTGDSASGLVTGRVYTEHVKEGAENLFFSQVVRPNHPARNSVVPVTQPTGLAMAEEFHRQSQQLPVRFFRLTADDTFALVVPLPDCDLDWVAGLDAAAVDRIDTTEELGFLETRTFRLLGTSQGWRIESLEPGILVTRSDFASTFRGLPLYFADELFGEDDALEITCPRCAARYTATREMMTPLLRQDRD